MKNVEKINSILSKNKGTITTSELTAANIPRHYLKKMIQKKILTKVDRGIYTRPETLEDEMYILQHKYGKGIYSHETALYIHGLTDRTPNKYTMTFPYGYHANSLDTQNVKAKKSVKKLYQLGLITGTSPYGNHITLYDIERTLCDIVKGDNKVDIQVVNQAMRKYVAMPEKNLKKLFDYAEKIRVKPKVMNYMRVLL